MNKVITFFFLGIFLSGCTNYSATSFDSDVDLDAEPDGYYGDYEYTIDQDEALERYWDEIKEYATGSETIEACSTESGNCYSLDADIYAGTVDTIYFPSGGYISFGADIDEEGYASEYDDDGNTWDFYIDMDYSDIIEDAVEEWAYDNGYTLE